MGNEKFNVKNDSENDKYKSIKWNGWGSRSVEMRLDRSNPFLVVHHTGKNIPGLVPYVNEIIYNNKNPNDFKVLPNTPSLTLEEVINLLPPSNLNENFILDLKKSYKDSQINTTGECRVCHAVGKNYRDLYRARNGMFEKVPDMVVFPESHEDCVKLMDSAVKNNIVLIPFGGGTNVVGGVEPNPFDKENRMIVTVDMRRMGALLELKKDSNMAHFQAGILGPDIDRELTKHGFHLGHDPDSYTYSTLGGWIAARSSGAQSNRYGDIEQIIVSITIVTPTGVVRTPVAPRAVGPNMNETIIGSEGAFGIITEAIVKVERIPPVRKYEGLFFSSFEMGLKAFQELTDTGMNITALRLYDEDETRLGLALKTEQTFAQKMLAMGVKKYLEYWKDFPLEKLALCIVGFEGSAEEVANQSAMLRKVFSKYKTFYIGETAGKNWQEKKYDLPYFRDFSLQHGMWADVFETAVEYKKAKQLWMDVKKAFRNVFDAERRIGWIGCHTAHQYRVGCCMYFTFAAQQKDKNDLEFFLKVKKAGMDAILANSGTLTHPHGIGYEHVPWMKRYNGQGVMRVLETLKQQMDPQGICNPGKLLHTSVVIENDEEAKKEMMFYRMVGNNNKSKSKL